MTIGIVSVIVLLLIAWGVYKLINDKNKRGQGG